MVTLRDSARSGLKARPPQRGSGGGEYPDEPLTRLRLIKQTEVDFSRDEIKDLLAIQPHGEITCPDRELLPHTEIAESAAKVIVLTELRGCCTNQSVGQACPTLGQHQFPA